MSVQMLPAFEAECVKEAKARGVTLPSDWSVKGLVEELRKAMMDAQDAVLKTTASLRCSGIQNIDLYTLNTYNF